MCQISQAPILILIITCPPPSLGTWWGVSVISFNFYNVFSYDIFKIFSSVPLLISALWTLVIYQTPLSPFTYVIFFIISVPFCVIFLCLFFDLRFPRLFLSTVKLNNFFLSWKRYYAFILKLFKTVFKLIEWFVLTLYLCMDYPSLSQSFLKLLCIGPKIIPFCLLFVTHFWWDEYSAKKKNIWKKSMEEGDTFSFVLFFFFNQKRNLAHLSLCCLLGST